MPSWRGSFFVACSILLLLAAIPVALGSSHTYVEDRSFRYYPVVQDQSFFEADFGPNGTDAYLAGGSFGREPAPDDQYVVRYNGASWDIVYKETGTDDGPVMDVAWQPDTPGDNMTAYALMPAAGGTDRTGSLTGSILACFDPCENATDVEEFWHPALTPKAQKGFAARQVDWHPSGDHALVSGSGLLRYNHGWWQNETEELFTTIAPGEETLFNAVEWHPSGDFALVQKDLNRIYICRAPCNTTADLVDSTHAFGESDGSKAIEEIGFRPDGEKAYVMGVDKQRSKLMEITFGADPTDPTTWEISYYNPQVETSDGSSYDKYGEVTSMEWYADGSSALLTSSLRMQVSSFPRNPADRHDFTRLMDLDGPKLYDASIQPDGGQYTLLGASNGFYRYDPEGIPVVNVTTPASGEDPEFVRPFDVLGTAEPKRDGRNISALQWRISDEASEFGAAPSGEWTNVSDENWTRASDGTVDWSIELDPSDMQPGRYVLGVRADDGEVLGAPGLTTFRVPGPSVHVTAPQNHTKVEGDVPVEGTAEARVPEDDVTGIEWRVTPTREPANPRFGGWNEGNLSDGPANNVSWSFGWDASKRSCYQTVEVRAVEGDIVGDPDHLVHYTVGCLSDPVDVSVDRVDNGNKTVHLNWTGNDAAESYTVEYTTGDDAGFFESAELATLEGDQTTFSHTVNTTGEYRYRVMASNPYEESPWGQSPVATVEEPADDSTDNGSDDPDSDDGTDPNDPGSDGDLIDGNGTDNNGAEDPGGSNGDPGGENTDTNTSGGPESSDIPGPGAAAAVVASAVAALRARRER
jgi:hypothetical protein